MSGYFVHGGTQYSFGQNSSQSQQNPGNQSYFSNTSYPTTHSGGQAAQYAGPQSGGGNNYQASPSGFSNQYNSGPGPNNASGSYRGNVGSNNSTLSSLYDSNSYPGASNYSRNSGNCSSTNNTQSAYEKALFNAASNLYSNRPRGATRGGRGGRGRGRGNFSQTPQNTGPKPIKVTEIKAFLYAWCGQRKLKPEYEVTNEADSKTILFTCRLNVPGLDHVSKVQSTSKKDAQSKAAWDLCENLVRLGYMKQSDLPVKPPAPAPKLVSGVTTTQLGSLPPDTEEKIAENGGWSLSNCRQRLNQFCQREHCTPVFKHDVEGPEHSRVFTCELRILVEAVKKEFVASEIGSNKKQATAICALSMVRQLYRANLIEKQGESMKHVTRGNLVGAKKAKLVEEPSSGASSAADATPGQKRKADDSSNTEQIDENGNWTVDNSRQRLNQFCQANNIQCDVMYEEQGVPGNRTYTASLNMSVKSKDSDDEKELSATATGQSKKVAAQSCALHLLSQLYKLTLVEANAASLGAPNKKKQNRKSDPPIASSLMMRSPPFGESFPILNNFAAHPGPYGGYPPFKKTFQQDLNLNEKHKQIYPPEQQLSVVQRSVRTVEQALKEVAEQMTEPVPESELKMEADGDQSDENLPKKKSKLQGVMRVGTLAKGLLLKGDLDVNLVLLCHEVPTSKLLAQVAQMLPKHIKTSEGDSFSVVTAIQAAAITVKNTTMKTDSDPSVVCSITITLTSPVVRTPPKEAAKDPPGALNKDMCLQALAELRHSKWFQACANSWPSCVIVIRIMRDMCRHMDEWKPLSNWALELIAEKAIATSPIALSLGGAFLRFMEVIASGVLLPGGPGVCDPCEREPVDALGNMSKQDREAITRTAQKAVRLFVYRQSHKVVGIEAVEPKRYNKFQHSTSVDKSADKQEPKQDPVKMES